jgi:hypothetical protein
VVQEIERIITHWPQLGAWGFRLNAASQAIGGQEEHGVGPERIDHYFGRLGRCEALDEYL